MGHHIWKNHTEDGKDFKPALNTIPYNKGMHLS
jgi:hypothetical protein